jgi:hypothetical protein
MSSLPELESSFGRCLLGDTESALLDLIAGDGLTPAARLQIYRNHVLVTLTDALKAIYPVVCQLVDERFFRFAADRYVRMHPPQGPCLFEYGESFAEFLATFPPCRELAYLPDVARLEWAMNRALHADDAGVLDPMQLIGVPAGQIERVTLVLHPSVSFLSSPWPVDKIWHANQTDADPEATVSLDAGGALLEIRRMGDEVVFSKLDAYAYAFRSALALGASLEQAADATCDAGPDADLSLVLQQLLTDGIVTSIGPMNPTVEVSGAN